jgi:hypothetical protein
VVVGSVVPGVGSVLVPGVGSVLVPGVGSVLVPGVAAVVVPSVDESPPLSPHAGARRQASRKVREKFRYCMHA